jgi:hypothetical protein
MPPPIPRARTRARLAAIGLFAAVAGAFVPVPAFADDAPSFGLTLSGDYYEQDYSFWVSPGVDRGPQPGYFSFDVKEWGDGFSDGTDVTWKMTSSTPLISLEFDGGSACTVEGDATVCRKDDFSVPGDRLGGGVAARISPEFEMSDAWLNVEITLSQGGKTSTYDASVEIPLISSDQPEILADIEFENGILYPDNPWVERPQQADLVLDIKHLPPTVAQPTELEILFGFWYADPVLTTTDERCSVTSGFGGDSMSCDLSGLAEGDTLRIPIGVDNIHATDVNIEPWAITYMLPDEADNDDWWWANDSLSNVAAEEDWAQYPAESISLTDVEPGFSGVLEGPRFNATGEQSIPGLVIEMGNFPGDSVALTAEYDNCVQEEDGVSIICVVTGFDPVAGETYQISPDTPIGIEVAETAAGPSTYAGKTWVSYDQQTWVADEYPELFKGTYDSPLIVEPAADDWTPESDDPLETGLIEVTTTENRYDLEPADVEITGAVGDKVSVDFTVANNGSADAAGAEVRLQLPTGVELAADAGIAEAGDTARCAPPQDLTADNLLGELVCTVGEIEAGSERTVSLEVEITGDAASSDGWVEVADLPLDPEASLESDLENNSASVHFKPAGADVKPNLPTTGSPLVAVLGTAAAVTALGVAMIVVLRRRRSAAAWQ